MSDTVKRPEKLFDIDLTILSVPASRIPDWIKQFEEMEEETVVIIKEIEYPEDTGTEE